MHELSIAVSIADIVKEEARKHQAQQVNKVVLHIGKLSGIEPEALYMAMKEVVIETELALTHWDYHWIDGVGACEDCCHEFDTEDYFMPCPICNSVHTFIVRGKEMHVQSIDIIKK